MSDRNILTLGDGTLRIRPRGGDRLWTFTRSIVVPLAAVNTVTVTGTRDLKRGIRTLGTDLGFKICGTFRADGNVNFWNYRAPGPLLALRLAPGERFTNLYLSVDDPERWRGRIEAARGDSR